MCQFFSYSALTRLLCLYKGGSRGWELVSISYYMMIMDELITELPFKDIVEIPHLDNNQNSSNSIHFRMSTNNDFLIEIDPDQNSSPNDVEKNRHD